jgi:hypothetical protein
VVKRTLESSKHSGVLASTHSIISARDFEIIMR